MARSKRSVVVGNLLRLLIQHPPGVCLSREGRERPLQILYAARHARFDLVCVVAKSAQSIATWKRSGTRRLVDPCATYTARGNLRQMGYVGDGLPVIAFHLYTDAELAGDASKDSTGGGHFTKFPIDRQSKRQDCVSHTTPELRPSQPMSPSSAKALLR